MDKRIKPEVPESTQNIEGDLRDLMPTSQEAYDGQGGCWPGDGSGMDDFEDWNQQEGWDMEVGTEPALYIV